jgi:hypothetical protein
MGGAGMRRLVFLSAAWAAVFIIRSLLHPEWGGDLSGAGSAASLACGLSLMRPARRAARGTAARRRPRHARNPAMVTDLLAFQVARLVATVDLHGARLGRVNGRLDSHDAKFGFVFRTLAEMAEAAGFPSPDKEDTAPQRRLTLLPGAERRNEAG